MYESERKEEPEEKHLNRTGIPDSMLERAEKKAGRTLSDVRVHYHSSLPAHVGALAYTQGNQIYISPGQERYLPHELGHVVQQKEGRVKPTMSLNGYPVNDDERLEREADGFL